MREAIGGSWLFQIVILFVVLFAAFLCVAINYSKAFKVKSEIVNHIEREQGIATDNIATELNKIGYRTLGSCNKDLGEVGFGAPSNMQNGTKYLYCIKRVCTKARNSNDNDLKDQAYYQIKVFFNLDIPVIGNWFNLNLVGNTKIINNPSLDSWATQNVKRCSQ